MDLLIDGRAILRYGVLCFVCQSWIRAGEIGGTTSMSGVWRPMVQMPDSSKPRPSPADRSNIGLYVSRAKTCLQGLVVLPSAVTPGGRARGWKWESLLGRSCQYIEAQADQPRGLLSFCGRLEGCQYAREVAVCTGPREDRAAVHLCGALQSVTCVSLRLLV